VGEPQGVLYRPDLDRIYIADGERGSVEIIDGKTYETTKSVKLRLNADAIAYDSAAQYLYVVNGGADAKMANSIISVVDTGRGETVGEIEVDGDDLEAMALEKSSPTMYVDNRGKNAVNVVNRQTHEVVATWPVILGKTMVAAVLDEPNHRLFVGCRDGHIVVIDISTGKELQALPIGKGIDDLVFDASSKRIYAACGEAGTVDVYEEVDADHYRLLGRIASGPHARNGLLISSLKQYVVAVPKSANEPARVLVYEVR
jgi:DNA-binding beta-propeller fold protein YncE